MRHVHRCSIGSGPITLTVGAGGTGGAIGTAGGNGGTTSFNTGPAMSVGGGSGGASEYRPQVESMLEVLAELPAFYRALDSLVRDTEAATVSAYGLLRPVSSSLHEVEARARRICSEVEANCGNGGDGASTAASTTGSAGNVGAEWLHLDYRGKDDLNGSTPVCLACVCVCSESPCRSSLSRTTRTIVTHALRNTSFKYVYLLFVLFNPFCRVRGEWPLLE